MLFSVKKNCTNSYMNKFPPIAVLQGRKSRWVFDRERKKITCDNIVHVDHMKLFSYQKTFPLKIKEKEKEV